MAEPPELSRLKHPARSPRAAARPALSISAQTAGPPASARTFADRGGPPVSSISPPRPRHAAPASPQSRRVSRRDPFPHDPHAETSPALLNPSPRTPAPHPASAATPQILAHHRPRRESPPSTVSSPNPAPSACLPSLTCPLALQGSRASILTGTDDQGGTARPSTGLRHPAELGSPPRGRGSAPAPPLSHVHASQDLRAVVTQPSRAHSPLDFPCTVSDCSPARRRPAPPLRSHAAVPRPFAEAVVGLGALRAFP